MRMAYELSQVLREVPDDGEGTDLGESLGTSHVGEDSICHQAMGILRRGFRQVAKLDDEYYSSAELSFEAQQGFVPVTLRLSQMLNIHKESSNPVWELTLFNTKMLSACLRKNMVSKFCQGWHHQPHGGWPFAA